MAEITTPFRKLAGAQKRPSRFRWSLVPRLIDTRRIRISNPLKNSSSRKSKKIAAKSCEIHNTSSTRLILTRHTAAERARSALQALQTTWSCAHYQLSEPLVAQRNSTGAVAMYTLLPRWCYKGKRLVTSSSAVPTISDVTLWPNDIIVL